MKYLRGIDRGNYTQNAALAKTTGAVGFGAVLQYTAGLSQSFKETYRDDFHA